MYILVEKQLATKKGKKTNRYTWKTYGLVIIRLLYLNECTSLIFLLWIILQRRNHLKGWFVLLRGQRRKHVWKQKIRNPRVYIYRATTVMLTSLCVSFWKIAVSFLWRSFPNLNSLRCWSLVSRLSPLRREAVKWVVAEVFRCQGVGEMWVWRNGTRVSAGLWVLWRAACPFLLFHPYSWVCIVRACSSRQGSRGPPLTHTQRAAYTGEHRLHGSRHERSWVFKALALSGNSWLGRHGGSWLLLLFLVFVV